MDSWLKKAEEAQRRTSSRKDRAQEHIMKRRALIEANYMTIGERYDALVRLFRELASRVNNLPMDARRDFGKIRYSFKETNLNNQLHIFSGSRKVYVKKLSILFPFFKSLRVKHIRVVYLSVSRETGFVEIELKDSYLQKRDIRKDETGHESYRRDHHRRTDLLYTMPLEEVKEDLAYRLMDWLAFHLEMEKLGMKKEFQRDISDFSRQRH
jgi:hypothetical protein